MLDGKGAGSCVCVRMTAGILSPACMFMEMLVLLGHTLGGMNAHIERWGSKDSTTLSLVAASPSHSFHPVSICTHGDIITT